MPLKAKVTNPAVLNYNKMSTLASEVTKALPEDDPDDVIFNTFYGARTIELNRPKKLNSLNGSMCRKIVARLLEWQKSQLASVVIIGGSGPKAFCAGGDVAALVEQNTKGSEGMAASQAYFGLEYQLDHLIATYQKPYVAYMDGITMGGGVGLSVHAPIRIATERTVFAMPETTIGLFPDVGGSFFLPRLDGEMGTYLALTSERLAGPNVFYAGIATHYIDSSTLPILTSRLAELEFKDYDTLATRLATISSTISEFSSGIPPNEHISPAGDARMAIDRCFRHNKVEDIISSLESESKQAHEASDSNADADANTNVPAWATRTLQTLSTRSPTSLKATLRLLRQGAHWTIAEAFQREYQLAGSFMSSVPDFSTGVTARLLTKPPTTPQWSPSTIQAVPDQTIEKLFEVEGKGSRLDLFGETEGGWAYKSYPFRFGLPSEEEVANVVRQGGYTVRKLLAKFQSDGQREGRNIVGLRDKVEEILDRKCAVRTRDNVAVLEWVGG